MVDLHRDNNVSAAVVSVGIKCKYNHDYIFNNRYFYLFYVISQLADYTDTCWSNLRTLTLSTFKFLIILTVIRLIAMFAMNLILWYMTIYVG